MNHRLCLVAAAMLAAFGASACSGSSSSSPADGAPAISALTLNPSSVPAGKVVAVQGTVAFSDPEGDVTQVAIALTPQNGAEQPAKRADAQNTAGQTSGTLSFLLDLQVPAPQTITVTLSVFDKAGNESNRLTGQITAQ